MRKKAKRIYGILMCVSMLLTLLKVPARAAEPIETGVGYEQEQEQQQEHAQEQKQIQEQGEAQEQMQTQGQAQNPGHEHTQSCYTLTENCVHEHTAECYPQTTGTGTVSGNNVMETVEAQPTECTHVCSEESGCITKEWNCGYNSENNGVPATVGASQGTGTVEAAEQEAETVTVESVQAMIDALPDAEEISSDNAEEVAEQLEAIDKAKTKLSDEEIDTLDFSKYMKAAAALGELSAPMLTSNGTEDVSTAEELTAALGNSSISKITLKNDITISSTLMVDRAVTLDLNGCVLKMTGSGSVIQIKDGGSLLIEDKNKLEAHKFTFDEDGLWKLAENSTSNIMTVPGGVITGGTGTQVPSYGSSKGGGVYIEPEGRLEMNGGSIVGCTADYGGGVYIDYDGDNKKYSEFEMNGGSIAGCMAKCGGGVVVEEGCNFIMNSGSEISYCTAKENAGTQGYGGGVMINRSIELGMFTMNGGMIHNCTADNNSGGVDNSGKFVMTGGLIYDCTAKSGGGVRNSKLFIMSGGTIDAIGNNDKSYIANYSGSLTISDNAEIRVNVSILNGSILNADGGEISGNVTNGDRDDGFGMITGSKGAAGSTRFSGSVTNTSDYKGQKSIIEKGTFTGSVTNKDGCIILGGDFSQANLSGNLEITFEPNNGGQNITQEVKWQKNGETLTDPKPVKENYTMEGWYYDDNGTEKKWDFDKDRTIYTMTLKAKWKPNTYTVNLEANGGTIANGKEVTDYTYGTDVTLPTKDDIIRKGYTFEGWYTDSSLSGSPVTEITGSDTGDKTFYAKWKQNTVPVMPGQTKHNDANHDNTNHDNTGDTNESSDTTPVIYPALTFDTCGGSSIKAVRAFEGHTINLSGYLPTREGYQFSGWYADRNLTQPVTEIRLDGNRTVYAGWIKQAEQTGESSRPKAAAAQLIADDNEKAVSKDSSQPLIEDYKPGSTDTSEDMEDQNTEDQSTGDQSTENTGDEQELTIDNSPMDDNSKPDDSADLAPEKTFGNNLGILIVCAFAGSALIGIIIYIIYKKGSKGRRL